MYNVFCNFMSRYKVIIPSLHYMYISHKLEMYYTIYTRLYISGFLGRTSFDQILKNECHCI